MGVVLLPANSGRETGQTMTNRRKRHSREQVVRKLGQADRMLVDVSDVAAMCRELGISEQTYYRWRNQYGGLKADDVKRLKELEKQNAILKRLLGALAGKAASRSVVLDAARGRHRVDITVLSTLIARSDKIQDATDRDRRYLSLIIALVCLNTPVAISPETNRLVVILCELNDALAVDQKGRSSAF